MLRDRLRTKPEKAAETWRLIVPDAWAEWLDPRNHDVDQLRALMAPPVDGSLDMYAVSKGREQREEQRP